MLFQNDDTFKNFGFNNLTVNKNYNIYYYIFNLLIFQDYSVKIVKLDYSLISNCDISARKLALKIDSASDSERKFLRSSSFLTDSELEEAFVPAYFILAHTTFEFGYKPEHENFYHNLKLVPEDTYNYPASSYLPVSIQFNKLDKIPVNMFEFFRIMNYIDRFGYFVLMNEAERRSGFKLKAKVSIVDPVTEAVVNFEFLIGSGIEDPSASFALLGNKWSHIHVEFCQSSK